MTAQPKRYITEAEYLKLERASTTKHEYYDGRIYAMTGGTEPHNMIASNGQASLHSQLRRRPCRVYGSDMRVKVLKTGLNTYPDVVVVCGQPQFTDGTHDSIVNPVAIIEVLSPSTERYDRGMKAQHYRTIETLRDYLLIAQDRPHVEHYARQESGQWLLYESDVMEDHLSIQSIGCTLALVDLYEKVDFDQGEAGLPRDLSPQ